MRSRLLTLLSTWKKWGQWVPVAKSWWQSWCLHLGSLTLKSSPHSTAKFSYFSSYNNLSLPAIKVTCYLFTVRSIWANTESGPSSCRGLIKSDYKKCQYQVKWTSRKLSFPYKMWYKNVHFTIFETISWRKIDRIIFIVIDWFKISCLLCYIQPHSQTMLGEYQMKNKWSVVKEQMENNIKWKPEGN